MVIKYKKIIIGILIYLVLLFISNLILTNTIYNPAVALNLYRIAVKTGINNIILEKESDTNGNALYPTTTISYLESGYYGYPRAKVTGTVQDTDKIQDDDQHINIKDENGRLLVVEMIPELQLPIPEVGKKITIWGVTRYDIEHRWWELHPITGWKYAD